jgi:C_GCAxxG_C_C family probable redox protein
MRAGGDVDIEHARDDALAEATADPGAAARARHRARELFLDDANTYGCAETALVVLQEAFGLPDPADASAAMALNGGVAYSGSTCGAVTGAALAVGQLAASRIDDHREAKRAAREITAELLTAFEAAFGATTCRALTGADLGTDEGHRAFIESGAWRDGCMRQIELAVGRLAPLDDADAWREATAAVGETTDG